MAAAADVDLAELAVFDVDRLEGIVLEAQQAFGGLGDACEVHIVWLHEHSRGRGAGAHPAKHDLVVLEENRCDARRQAEVGAPEARRRRGVPRLIPRAGVPRIRACAPPSVSGWRGVGRLLANWSPGGPVGFARF